MSVMEEGKAPDIPASVEELGRGHVEAYEKVLRVLLDFRTVEEMRDVFRRPLVQEAADGFAHALDETRARRQPEQFALAWAIEAVVHRRMAEQGVDIDELFNDPAHHAPPADDLAATITAMWERTA